MVMSGCILILAFGSIAWQNISLGRIIAMLVILLCSRYGSVTGGAISGISTGAIFSIASRENGYICGGFAFGGLMAGLFSQLGKLGCAIAFVISNGVMCLAFGSQFGTPSGVLVESLAASAVFMVLPKEVGNVISPVFSSDKIHRSERLCEKYCYATRLCLKGSRQCEKRCFKSFRKDEKALFAHI